MISPLFCQACGAANESTLAYCFACGQYLVAEKERMDGGGELLLHDRYQLDELLGSGGFSVVYRARDMRENGCLVAIKQISLQGLSAEEAIDATETFNREVHILSILNHPQVPRIYDHFSDQVHWYLVLEYIAGQTLETYLDTCKEQGKVLSLEEILSMALQLCWVLEYLHSHQPPLIYRDLKPGNIMRTPEGMLYLIDFGIARRFRPSQGRDTQPLGSPGYAAPEQYGSAQTTPQADIYSLGVLLYRLLSGQDPSNRPFSLPPLQLNDQIGGTDLAMLVARMLSFHPMERPDSVRTVTRVLMWIKQHRDAQRFGRPWQLPTPQVSLPIAGGQQMQALLSSPAQVHSSRAMSSRWEKRVTRRKVLAIGGIGVLATGVMSVDASFWLRGLWKNWLRDLWTNLNAASDDIYAGQNGPVYSIAWNVGAQIASASSDKTVQVIDLGGDPDSYRNSPPSSYSSTSHTGAVTSVAWSSDGVFLASASADGSVQVSQLSFSSDDTVADGNEILTYTGHSAAVQAVVWSPDGKNIASASSDGSVHVWNAQTGQTLTTKSQPGALYAIAWSPNSNLIAFGGAQETVFVWNPTNGRILSTYQGHTGTISGLVWSPDGAQIASASADGSVHIWMAIDGIHSITYARHTAAVRGVDWSPDGAQIASASADGSVHIWNARDASPIYIYRRHRAAVNTVAWAKGFDMVGPGIVGPWIASGSDDKTVRIWNVGEAGSDVKAMRNMASKVH